MGLGIAVAVNGTPDAELAAAQSVVVYERVGKPATYTLRYGVDIKEGDLPWLKDGRLDPGSAISVLAPSGSGDKLECLVKGPVRGQRIHLAHGGSGSWLEVCGADTSITMNRENKAALWANTTDTLAVSGILGQYGFTPDVEFTSALHTELKHVLVQRDTDWQFVKRLAQRNGFLFWVTCDAHGLETAHFKRPPLSGEPAAELVINLDLPSLETLDIHWDVETSAGVKAAQLDLNAKTEINGDVDSSPLTPLGDKDLKAIAGGNRVGHLAAPVDDAGDLRGRSEGALIEAGWFVRATGSTSVQALGGLLRSHCVVQLKGAGSRHSGKYFVAGVRHIIDSTAHRMEFELWRNAWNG